ncbi:hypothetical protein L2719_05120 [Shewanella schlegeliana]|uniref:Uncharacterized protein n=1 Tax=Shewanella schlegeliana TaxID=190308 RepID=A0ABS1SWQ3_9GAMM|nr:hypothetical protein [Shewanella schlegeliana]MBL4912976.1 hypothetical protein [Shewanella schlegeliana]MCL1108928.1 hypothetical protein [Shewanella schlegeliana]GIU23657.1 hypothetical protein TUM4433_06470 [Shewanella schlegeliana]
MNYATTSKIPFSGRMAFIAALLMAFGFIGQASAQEFTDKERAAIDGHYEILAEHQAESDQALESKLQAEFDEQVLDSEQEFMELTCATHGLDFDSESEVCYE